jgi:hypothetical protein
MLYRLPFTFSNWWFWSINLREGNLFLFGICISVRSEIVKFSNVTYHTLYTFKIFSLNLLPRVLSPRLNVRNNLNYLNKYTKPWNTYTMQEVSGYIQKHFYSELSFHRKFTASESDYQSYTGVTESNKMYFIINMLHFTISN